MNGGLGGGKNTYLRFHKISHFTEICFTHHAHLQSAVQIQRTMNASTEEKLPAYTNHDGFLLPVGFPTESFDSGRNYEAQDNGEKLDVYKV